MPDSNQCYTNSRNNDYKWQDSNLSLAVVSQLRIANWYYTYRNGEKVDIVKRSDRFIMDRNPDEIEPLALNKVTSFCSICRDIEFYIPTV